MIEALPALDATRPLGRLTVERSPGGRGGRRSAGDHRDVRDLALVLAAAERAGVARWCLDTASDYAKVRVQFGRPIGQFQAVKHALADMLVAVEQCAAVAWDAAAAWECAAAESRRRAERALSARGWRVRSACRPAAHCAKECIQVLGGIGFTWEHDAHFYLEAGHGQPASSWPTWARSSTRWPPWPSAGARRRLTADLPDRGGGPPRAEVRLPWCEVAAAAAGPTSGPPWPRPG